MNEEIETNTVETYINNGTWRMKENANQIFCSGHLMNFLSARAIYDFWMNKTFSDKAKKYHEEGRIHIHDLSRMTPYCTGFSTKEIIIKGLKGPKGRIVSSPPKHMSSAINQLINFVGVMSQEFAGAIALNDFSLYLAPYVYYDKLDYKQIKQEMQMFSYHLNQPNRWAGECPFTNVTINLKVPEDMKDIKVWVGNEVKNKTYKEFEKEMNMINEALLDVLNEGDVNGTPMTFPVLTIGITDDFPWDSEIATKIFQVTAKYGTPFFENFGKKTGRDPSSSRSLCCRLLINTDEIIKHTGGLFGHGDSMGSMGVVTINLNKIGYESKNKEDYYKQIDDLMEVTKDTLIKRRNKIIEMYDLGLYPYTKLYLKNYNNYFNTIGVIGGNESMLNFMGKTLMDDEAREFMEDVLDYMLEKCLAFQKETKQLFNLEAVPGEGCMHSLAKKDRKMYKDIIVGGKDEVFLTNSTQPPVEETNFLDVVRKQESLQVKYSGGTTVNIYIGERLNNYKQAKKIIKTLIEKTRLPYFSIVPTYSICREHGYIAGEKYRCPECNKNCEVFSRVVGYLKPKNSFNIGKLEEFKQRKYYDVNDIEKLNGDVDES